MSSRTIQFNRPVEFDPSLIRQQPIVRVTSATNSTSTHKANHYLTKEEILLNDLGFERDEESKTADFQGGSSISESSIPPVYDDDCDTENDVDDSNESVLLSVAGDEEVERLVEQVSRAREAQVKAESSARRAEERVEELQRMSKQAKNILVKQFKDQINSLLRELEEQKQMLAEDDETIQTLRLALSRWEHGDGEGAKTAQAQINEEHNSRELQRQLTHLTETIQLRDKQMTDLQAELDKYKQTDKQNTDTDTDNTQRQEMQTSIHTLEHEKETLIQTINEHTNTISKQQQQIQQLQQQLQQHQQSVSVSQHTQRRLSLVSQQREDQLLSMQQLVDQQKVQILAQQREMELVKRLAEESEKHVAIASESSTAAIQREQLLTHTVNALEQDKLTLQESLSVCELSLKRRDEEFTSMKDKAKDKLSVASESIKKLKTEYSTLRSAYAKLKAEGNTEQHRLKEEAADRQQRQHRQLTSIYTQLQLAKSELSDMRVAVQAVGSQLITQFQPLLLRHLHSLADHHKAETANLTVAYRKEQALRKQLFNQIQELKGNIRVYCRVRPLSHREKDSDVNAISFPEENCLSITNQEKKATHQFQFEQVFNQESTQDQVFGEVSELVTSVMDGYNVCIFAYGQTGSGKTFTMQGTTDNPGVNIRALERLFQIAGDRNVDTEYVINMSLLEIYNDKIQDLFSNDPSNPLKVVQGTHGMSVQDLTVVPVTRSEDVLAALTEGSKNRKVSSTAMNADSSRSHLILTVYVLGKSRFALPSGQTKEVMGKLHLIDLAGSERISRSGVTGDALKEAQAINTSLSALGNCIAARANKNAHVPYRDSTLTYLLQDSLEKNSKTLMFVQVSPNSSDSVLRHALCAHESGSLSTYV